MRKKKLQYAIGIISMIAIFVLVGSIFYKNIKYSVTESDILVEGALKLNSTGINDYKEYLLEIKMILNKDCHMIIYPYIKDFGPISFGEEVNDNYYVPSSIGRDSFTESTALHELKRNNIIDNEDNISLVGFWVSDKTGQYVARTYLDTLKSIDEIKNPVLVCVYVEEKHGKKLSWSKIIPIKIA